MLTERAPRDSDEEEEFMGAYSGYYGEQGQYGQHGKQYDEYEEGDDSGSEDDSDGGSYSYPTIPTRFLLLSLLHWYLNISLDVY